MAENSRMIKAASIVGAATFLSRILGFVRDAVIAWLLGAGFSSDAFIAAFRIPNLVRRLFAEGSLSAAFIPKFADCMVNKGQGEAFDLARSAFKLLGIVLMALVIGGILFAPWIARVIAPGFAADKLSLTVNLTRLMFPYLFFAGMLALCMGILNVLGHFAAPALAPVLLNITIIGSVFFLSPHLKRPVVGIALGVLIGGFLQLVLQLPVLRRLGFRFWSGAKLKHPELKKMALFVPGILLGSAVYQINIIVGTLLGSLLAEGSVTFLYFADRLVQFPLGIFAMAAATAVLPSLSRQAAARQVDELRDTFSQALKLVFFISIPAMVGLIVLREPIVTLIFQRGEFDASASRLTAQAVLYYSVGLWAFSAVRILAATFFALQDIRTPVLTAVISIVANFILGLILMKPLAHGGLALATSLASILNLGLLVRAIRAKLGPLGWKNIALSTAKTVINSTAMGLAVWAAAGMIVPMENRTPVDLLSGVAACIGIGLCSYVILSFLVKSQELKILLAEARKGADK